ncbi:methyl-accepting chemotaxis protein [Vibrio gallaecicus]|uniref:methyl-accepting chemotaxis protein n=1 Tax=Vibrio gallaecicus TaxID=552386 RepID=UPI0010C96842|nr:methyl-accepting chemotaxis protein [Vibrio gallaecicus]MDN3612897.1 methyl-accepting chemotaxis protein [Vibrio gallaecicus]
MTDTQATGKSLTTPHSFSLINTISIVFLVIIVLVSFLSFASIRGVERIGKQFDSLSEQALPLALNNAELTQSVLEQVKLISYSTQTTDLKELKQVEGSINRISEQSNSVIQELFTIAQAFPEAITPEQKQAMNDDVNQLQQHASNVISRQIDIQARQIEIDKNVAGFRYGLTSIGAEMNRISSFLVEDNPEALDAANRFVASATAMEGLFLVLMMQTELEKAELEYKEMRNRKASVNLAFDDFKEWHPDIVEFASLTAPYEMVSQGFSQGGVLKQILSKLELMEQQKSELTEIITLANSLIGTLNQISYTASTLIDQSEDVVNSTITSINKTLLISGIGIASIVFIAWLVFRQWTNKGLNNIVRQLNLLASHDFSKQADIVGPRELQYIATKLNSVVASTSESVTSVTRNCETLYQTAEVSHDAAEQTSSSLLQQNESLQNMIATISQLEASIGEIATITNASNEDASLAAAESTKGSEVVGLNQQRLQALEKSLSLNEVSMHELDSQVKQIREMVDMISGIAESTNLLALNAAIEAARAGEQGRGFAVVADEVRKLASDTSQQTTNIRVMMNELVSAADKSRTSVTESRKEMASALQTSGDVQQAFGQIEYAVEQIRGRVEQIMVATEEQARATTDVTSSITRISDQGELTKQQLESMVGSSQQVAQIAGNQQVLLHKYVLV